MGKVCFGIDIGGTTVKIGILSEEGQILDKWEIKTRTEDQGAHIVSDIADSLKDAMAKKGYSKDDVVGAGMGVPGPVMEDGTINRCVNLGWGVYNAAAELSDLLGIPVKAGNDANVAALGEEWQGGGKGHENVVMITLGTGVGGGIILGGKILSGTTGAGGEIGHMTVTKDHDLYACGCGRKGCLETLTSATGIVNIAKDYVAHTDKATAMKDLAEITSKDVFDLAKSGDEGAIEVVDKVAGYLGAACNTIAVVVNPEIFVIGGGVSKAGQYLIDKVQESFKAQAFHAVKDTKFALATLGNDAGMVGAAKLVLQ